MKRDCEIYCKKKYLSMRKTKKKYKKIKYYFGFFLACLGIWILYWNEKMAISMYDSINDTLDNVVHVSSIHQIDRNNEGSLIYISGPLRVDEPLTEPDYGISLPAVKLKRRVQMYQWVESQSLSIENETYWKGKINSYVYTTEWKDRLINSSEFYYKIGHHNPKELPMKTKVYLSEGVYVGKYRLNSELISKINNYISITSDERPERRDIKIHVGLYYHSIDVWNPEVGDIRLQFSYAGGAGQLVSIVAFQNGTELQGGLLTFGKVSMHDMITGEHSQNAFYAKLSRVLACIVLYVAMKLVNKSKIYSDTNLFATIVFLVTAIAWYTYKLWIAYLLIAGAAICISWPLIWDYKTYEHYHNL